MVTVITHSTTRYLTEPEDFEDFDGDEDMVDLRAYRPLGGIIHFNLFHMPPQPKSVKSWTITKRMYKTANLSQHSQVIK